MLIFGLRVDIGFWRGALEGRMLNPSHKVHPARQKRNNFISGKTQFIFIFHK